MSVRRNAVALLATCLCVAGPAWAQVRVEAQAPSQVIDDLTQPVAAFQLPPVDAAALLADNAERGKAGAFRWGIEIPLELDLKQLGTRDALPDGGSVWRLQLDTLGALAVALGFSEFDLPQGAGLWVHAADGSQTYGAFTALNNKADRQFAVLPMPGQSVPLLVAASSSKLIFLRSPEGWWMVIVLDGLELLRFQPRKYTS